MHWHSCITLSNWLFKNSSLNQSVLKKSSEINYNFQGNRWNMCKKAKIEMSLGNSGLILSFVNDIFTNGIDFLVIILKGVWQDTRVFIIKY